MVENVYADLPPVRRAHVLGEQSPRHPSFHVVHTQQHHTLIHLQSSVAFQAKKETTTIFTTNQNENIKPSPATICVCGLGSSLHSKTAAQGAALSLKSSPSTNNVPYDLVRHIVMKKSHVMHVVPYETTSCDSYSIIHKNMCDIEHTLTRTVQGRQLHPETWKKGTCSFVNRSFPATFPAT